MLIDYALLGKRLADLRRQKHMSQSKLAEKANISNNYLSHIETSRSIPSLETLMSLCFAVDVTPNTLLLGANVTQDDYMVFDIERKLARCTEAEKQLIYDFIDVVLKQRKK